MKKHIRILKNVVREPSWSTMNLFFTGSVTIQCTYLLLQSWAIRFWKLWIKNVFNGASYLMRQYKKLAVCIASYFHATQGRPSNHCLILVPRLGEIRWSEFQEMWGVRKQSSHQEARGLQKSFRKMSLHQEEASVSMSRTKHSGNSHQLWQLVTPINNTWMQTS